MTPPRADRTAHPTGGATDQEVFAPQIEHRIRIDHALQEWLREQIAAAGADGAHDPEGWEP